MNNKLYVLLAAGVLALSACNSPTAEQKADEAAAEANAADKVSTEMKQEAGEAKATAEAEKKD